MLNIYARIMNALHDERGDVSLGGGGLLVTILVVLLIICAIVFLWMNIDINEK